MKTVTLVSVFFMIVFTASLASAQTASIVKPYDTVEIEKFTVGNGVEFPAKDLEELMGYLVLNFNKSKRFNQVFLSTDAASSSAPVRRVKISGEVTQYSKGNRAARYLIGLGAGRTKLVAGIKVKDAETGEVLMEQKVDGHVYGGLFGGETDQAKGGLSSEIIKTMTKKGLASKTRKAK